ncbi:hypothetical protein ACWDNU_45540, partial [Amycolatopsis sp. NPDC003676]
MELHRQRARDLTDYAKLLRAFDPAAVDAARDALAPHLGLPRGGLPLDAAALAEALSNRAARGDLDDLTGPLADYVRALAKIDPYAEDLVYNPETDPRAVGDDPPVHDRDALDFLREVGADDLTDRSPLPPAPEDAVPGPSRDHARLLGVDLTGADAPTPSPRSSTPPPASTTTGTPLPGPTATRPTPPTKTTPPSAADVPATADSGTNTSTPPTSSIARPPANTPPTSSSTTDTQATENGTGETASGHEQSGGAIRPRDIYDSAAQDAWAEAAYEQFRATDNDVDGMVDNLADTVRPDGSRGYSRDDIARVKDHLFRSEHPLAIYDDDGNTVGTEIRRYDASAAIAEAWMRMSNGTPLPEDIVLLEHELTEAGYYESHPGASYHEAHDYANTQFDWESNIPARTGENIDEWTAKYGDKSTVPPQDGDRAGRDLPVREPRSTEPGTDDSQVGLHSDSGGRENRPTGSDHSGQGDDPA